MRNKLSYAHSDVKKTPNNGSNAGTHSAETGARRLRKIEELLGVCIAADCSDISNHEELSLINRYDQTIKLLNAFDLITDPKCRTDILAMVVAAAQREHQSD